MNFEIIKVGLLKVNCVILWDDNKNAIIFDPGDDSDKIIKFISDYFLQPKAIFLTHKHFDHIGCADELKKVYGILAYANANLGQSCTHNGKTATIDIGIHDNQIFNIGSLNLKALECKGHSECGMCFMIEHLLITGDTLFKETIGRTDLPGSDYEKIKKSLLMLKNLPGNYIIIPGHGKATTLDDERKNNPFYSLN